LPATRILIVEDDAAIASGLELNLKLEGFAPAAVGSGEQALAWLRTHSTDLVLLDISLPRMTGLDVLRAIRTSGDTVPVVVLSARQDEFDKVAALRLGADDYVTKPFGVAELLARIDAVLRRVPPRADAAPAPRTLAFADVSVNLDTREVTRRGEPLALTHLEFELLCFLLQNPGRVFDRRQLLRQVWGVDHGGSPRTVDNFIAQLRQKLEQDPNEPRHLVTVRGSGYRFDPR
jgi:DNA-binding response OmpR family regulator